MSFFEQISYMMLKRAFSVRFSLICQPAMLESFSAVAPPVVDVSMLPDPRQLW